MDWRLGARFCFSWNSRILRVWHDGTGNTGSGSGVLDDIVCGGFSEKKGPIFSAAVRGASAPIRTLQGRHSIIGLYLEPPTHAMILSVDEKPTIQVIERPTGYLKTSSVKVVRGLKSTYKRHGTVNPLRRLKWPQ